MRRSDNVYISAQVCGLAEDDVKVDIRTDENGGEHLTIRVRSYRVVMTLSNSPGLGEPPIKDIARDLIRKITDAVNSEEV